MALRTNITTKKKSLFFSRMLKIACSVVLSLAAIICGLVLYFNDQNIKAPLLKFISQRTSLNINCNNVEFSALYPNVLKLSDISINHSHIDEIYIEYDLDNLINSKSLNIKYLYCKGLNLADEDLQTLKKEKFNYNSIEIAKLDLVNSKLSFNQLYCLDASLSVEDVLINQDNKLSFTQGNLSFLQAKVDDIELKKFSSKIKSNADRFLLTNFTVQVFGGNAQGNLELDLNQNELTFSNLSLSNMIFKDQIINTLNYSISAPSVSLYNCVYAFNKQDILLGQISGNLTDVSVKNGINYLDFEGKVKEFSVPQILTTADNNQVNLKVRLDSIEVQAQGNLYSGQYTVNASYSKNFNQKQLIINDFEIKNAKLEPDEHLYNYLKAFAFKNKTLVQKASILNCEFVSHFDKLPLTIKDLSVTTSNYTFDDKTNAINSNLAKLSLLADSAYYQDLFISQIQLESSLTDKDFALNVSKLLFDKSNLSIDYKFSYQDKKAKLKATSKDFDLSRLNSSLFNHLLSGNVSLNLDLSFLAGGFYKAEDQNSAMLPGFAKLGYGDYLSNDSRFYLKSALIDGILSVSAKEMLISELGLDLINGGIKKDFVLNTDDFLYAIKGSDLGLYHLEFDSIISDSLAKFKLSSDLTSSHITYKGTLDLISKYLTSKGTFVSLAKDNITSIKVDGLLDKLVFSITALSRGEIKEGINTDHLDKNVKEASEDNQIHKKATPLVEETESNDEIKLNDNKDDKPQGSVFEED